MSEFENIETKEIENNAVESCELTCVEPEKIEFDVDSYEEDGNLAGTLVKAGLVLGGALIGGAIVKFGTPLKEKAAEFVSDAKEKREAKKAEKQAKKDEKKAAKEAKKKSHVDETIDGTATEIIYEDKEKK